jgi:hypothetical protein
MNGTLDRVSRSEMWLPEPGLGVPCCDAQCDGVPCRELRADCNDCERTPPHEPHVAVQPGTSQLGKLGVADA